MTYNLFNRRLHLYLALALLPWFLMYALSSLVYSHDKRIARLTGAGDDWTLRFAKSYDGSLASDADEAERREIGRASCRERV